MTLEDHWKRALAAWQNIRETTEETLAGHTHDEALSDSLHAQTSRYAWLYPLVVAKRGRPY